MPQHSRAGIVQNHTGRVEHTADYIDCVLGALKALGQFLRDASEILDFDIPPAVDVDLLNPCPKHVLGEEGKLRHLGINGIHQFLTVHPLYCDPVVLHILGDIALNLILDIPAPLVDDQRRIFTGNILLHFF